MPLNQPGEKLIRTAPVEGALDAFGRQRFAEPYTIFDSKQVFDNLPLFWDDQEVSGADTASIYNQPRASTYLTVSPNTAGKRVRQTFRRFNYQPGKSQLIFLTATLGGGGTGITAMVGLVDDDNGVYFYSEDGEIGVGVRSSASGSPVDTDIPQSAWNQDRMDGTDKSRIKIDPTKAQILVIDLEWLGVGTVRFGFVVDGEIHYCHYQHHANVIDSVYMSTPNLPLRYSIENDGTGPVAQLEHICSTVISEGGQEETGTRTWLSTSGTHFDAQTNGTLYGVLGMRLKTTHLGATILTSAISMIAETNDDFEWVLVFNPSVTGSPTWADVANSSLQISTPNALNVASGGTPMAGGWQAGGGSTGSFIQQLENALTLGAAIDGTRDEIWLCSRPLSNGLDIQAGLILRELL